MRHIVFMFKAHIKCSVVVTFLKIDANSQHISATVLPLYQRLCVRSTVGNIIAESWVPETGPY
jgi:hypothetical protein